MSEQSETFQTESAWHCTTADAKHLIFKVTHSVPGPFNEIIICALFISVNTIHKFLWHEHILANHGYHWQCQKLICIYPGSRNKGFLFTMKEVWDRACSLENQIFNINSCKWLFISSLKSFTWF